jgi:Uncharacterised nucleotidyltransferase
VNVISLSLWGNDERYTQGAIRNAQLAPEIYSGWTLRVYCSPEVPVLDVLRSLGADVRIVPAAPGQGGLFWRFLPAGETELDHVIVRDADSRLNVREKAAVDAWIASGRPFHVMRDHVHHRTQPMLAGMWGCRGGSIPDIRERIARFARGARKHEDTKFLREEVWPLARRRCLVHSSVPEPLGGDPFPTHPPFDGFVGEIVDPRAEARDVVAILLPSRGRPEAALAAARSARATASAPEHVRLVVGVEPAEAHDYREVFGADAPWIHVLRFGGSYVRAIRELHHATTAGIYGLCADDFVFETPGWDSRIRRAVADLPERVGLVHADDGIQHDRIATAAFLTAEWIACVEDVLPGDYEHMFSDTEITEIARLAGLLRYLPDVKITHQHHLVGQALFDVTYRQSAATMAAGGAEFERRRRDRQELADRLAIASRAPMLSILIPGLLQRAHALDDLVARLHRQREALADPSIVEVLVEPDAGERSAAGKRKTLLGRARGRWVAFVEDDDVVADDATALILRALAQDPDCVSSDRVLVIRRSIALVASRKNVIGREGFRLDAISPFIEREVTVDQAVVQRPLESEGGGAQRAVGASRARGRRPFAAPGLPSQPQQLLLTAALRRDERALRAWEEWIREIGPERADSASTRLFPLVWWNLQRLEAGGIEINSLKPHYWSSWAASQAHVEVAGEAAAAFQAAGIPTLLLSGVALGAHHYKRPELRPMRDVDLLVPDAFAAEARRRLISAGWRPIENLPDSAFGFVHELGFQDRLGRLLDLHWRALHESPAPSIDDGLWARAETVEIGGAAARILGPADQLLHACVHGLRWAETPAIHWVADVMAILESAASRLDWEVLIAETRVRHVVMQARRALQHVRVTFGVSALDGVCERLSALRCTVADRIDFQARVRPPSLPRDVLRLWIEYSRLHGEAPRLSRYLGFPAYLRAIRGLRSLRAAPGPASRTDARRLRGQTQG